MPRFFVIWESIKPEESLLLYMHSGLKLKKRDSVIKNLAESPSSRFTINNFHDMRRTYLARLGSNELRSLSDRSQCSLL